MARGWAHRPTVVPMVQRLGGLPPGDDAGMRVLAEARTVLERHRHALADHCTAACPPMPGSRPLCQEQLPIHGDPTRDALRCDLPSGHHSEEHYDRASGCLWLPPGVEPRVRPPLPDPLDTGAL